MTSSRQPRAEHWLFYSAVVTLISRMFVCACSLPLPAAWLHSMTAYCFVTSTLCWSLCLHFCAPSHYPRVSAFCQMYCLCSSLWPAACSNSVPLSCCPRIARKFPYTVVRTCLSLRVRFLPDVLSVLFALMLLLSVTDTRVCLSTRVCIPSDVLCLLYAFT